MDAHVAPTAHKIGPYQLHALVEKAIADHMPDLAEERRLAKADGRYFTIEAQQDSFDGTASVHGELDLADAHDLETAVAGLAAQLKDLGSEDTLDVRRALAVGEMARARLTLDLNPTSVEPVETSRRQVVLYVHLSDQALAGAAGTARLERGNSQVTAGQVRDWCGTAGSVVVKPVIDLDAHDPVEQSGGAGPARRDRHPARQDLRLPLVQPAARTLRQGPFDPPQPWRSDVSVQFGAVVSAAPPDQDPRRLVLPHDRARHLPVDVQARVPVPPRHHRHPRRLVRPTPATRLATSPTPRPRAGPYPCPVAALPQARGFEAQARSAPSHLNHRHDSAVASASASVVPAAVATAAVAATHPLRSPAPAATTPLVGAAGTVVDARAAARPAFPTADTCGALPGAMLSARNSGKPRVPR